eukprot:PhF_6_TR23296/c1_g2_i4/m.32865
MFATSTRNLTLRSLTISDSYGLENGCLWISMTLEVSVQDLNLTNCRSQYGVPCLGIIDVRDSVTLRDIVITGCSMLGTPTATIESGVALYNASPHATISNLLVEDSSTGCLEMRQPYKKCSVYDSTFRRCGRHTAVKYSGQSIRISNMTIDGSSSTNTSCINITLPPDGARSFSDVKLVGCASLCNIPASVSNASPRLDSRYIVDPDFNACVVTADIPPGSQRSKISTSSIYPSSVVASRTSTDVIAVLSAIWAPSTVAPIIRNGELIASCNGYAPSAVTTFLSD